MLDLENGLNPEISTLLDRKRLVLEPIKRARGGQVDDDIVAPRHLQREGLDDAFPGVVGVADGSASVQTQGGLPAV